MNINNVGSGQFIVMCDPTVTADADLLSPVGSVGHVHNFFGPQSLPKKGSTLRDGKVGNSCTTEADQSAYWIPALLVAGQKVAPQRIQAYYRLSGGEVAPPRGLGYATGSSASGPWARWLCVGNGTQREKVTANACQKGEYLSARVTFPSCWNGVDRTTPDQQHMHYPNEDGHCPPTHPTRVPQLELFAQWDCSVVCSGPRQVTLTSGHSSTLHGDVVISWRKQALKRLVSDCFARDCSIVTSPKE